MNGKRHRIDGPALEKKDGSKYWLVNDELHKIDTHDLNPDWTQWTESEKVLFRLAV